ncbi:MAG TPA: dTMP kinase [Blastocatellia bacterium]|jgi:dTMP kinase|nr:dTMP kinase [Blastocatellia bacterium]
MRGIFITLEGMDGCGKSTQLEMLALALRERGLDFVVTREPGGTPLGEGVRELLVSDASVNVSAATELFLIVGARAQHVAELIKPGLAAGRLVISDRYTDSTVAFQGYGRGIDLSFIGRMNRFATDGVMPDLTIIFDLEPELARTRLSARPVGGLLGAFDEEALEFHARVREGYFWLAASEPSRVRVVDSSGTPEETHAKVMSLVGELISDRRRAEGLK